MKKLYSVLIVLLFVMLVCGNAWSRTAGNHVRISGDGNGDVVIFPIYLAADGWSTKITVINTDTVNSTVAKVVFWSQVLSEEVLDFFIYLSPADVWTGTIQLNDVGKVAIVSADDSVRLAPKTFASATNPWRQDFFNADCPNLGDNNFIGYATVFQYKSFDVDLFLTANPGSACMPNQTDRNWRRTRPVDKRLIECLVDDPLIPVVTLDNMTGYYEIASSTLGISSINEATVLENYRTNRRLTLEAISTFDEFASTNTRAEVEAALAVTELHMPYEKELTAHILTFPTKSTYYKAIRLLPSPCAFLRTGDAINNLQSPYFAQNGKFNATFTQYRIFTAVDAFDISENLKAQPQGIISGGDQPTLTPLPNEVNLLVVGGDYQAFDSGWVRYRFSTTEQQPITAPLTNGVPAINAVDVVPNTNIPAAGAVERIRFTGTPVIGTVFTLTGSGKASSGMMSPAKRFGTVSYSTDSGVNYNVLWPYHIAE